MGANGNHPGRALVPAAPMTTAEAARVTGGEVAGRMEVLPDGELVFRVRPAQYRDVTGRPIHPAQQPAPEPPHRHYRGCSCRYGTVVAYTGPLTPRERAKDTATWARWMDPPWWAAVRWIPDQRRLRAQLKQEQVQIASAQRSALPPSAVAGPRPRELKAAPARGSRLTRLLRWWTR